MSNTTNVLQELSLTIVIVNAHLAILQVANSVIVKQLAQFVTKAYNFTKKEIFVLNAHSLVRPVNLILKFAYLVN